MKEWLDDCWHWCHWHLVKDECPFCGKRCILGFHDCEKFSDLTAPQCVNLIASKVRDILKDDPADRQVYGVYVAMDELEKKFQA
jgi:hypothetical protein